MTGPIVALWWFFLVAALIVTLVDVYLLLKVVRFCRQIRALTKATLPAAVSIAQNTDAGRELEQTVDLVGSLAQKTGAVEKLTAALANRLLPEAR